MIDFHCERCGKDVTRETGVFLRPNPKTGDFDLCNDAEVLAQKGDMVLCKACASSQPKGEKA